MIPILKYLRKKPPCCVKLEKNDLLFELVMIHVVADVIFLQTKAVTLVVVIKDVNFLVVEVVAEVVVLIVVVVMALLVFVVEVVVSFVLEVTNVVVMEVFLVHEEFE
jgi:hypothetical protein